MEIARGTPRSQFDQWESRNQGGVDLLKPMQVGAPQPHRTVLVSKTNTSCTIMTLMMFTSQANAEGCAILKCRFQCNQEMQMAHLHRAAARLTHKAKSPLAATKSPSPRASSESSPNRPPGRPAETSFLSVRCP